MKTILFPTDFSPKGQEAMDFAISWCLKHQARMVFQHAYFNLIQESDTNPEIMQSIQAQMAMAVETHQEALRSKLNTQYPELQFEIHAQFGFPAEVILEAARKHHADLIIMATKGVRGFIDQIAGTTAMGVIEHAQVPVLTIPYGHLIKQTDHLLFATDYDVQDREVISQILKWTQPFNAQIRAIHIVEPFEPQIDRASKLAETFNGYFPDQPITFKNLNREEIASGIETYIENHQTDMLVLVHKHRGLWNNLFHAGITRYFAHHAKLPLLVMPS